MAESRDFFTKYGFLLSLVYLTIVCAGFFVMGAISNQSWELWYLLWNLFLAWVPLGFALWLMNMLKRKSWSTIQGMVLSLLWLGFLPNSFYMVSDYLHLQDYPRVDIVYDTVTFTCFVLTGLFLGYASLYLVHIQLAKRLKNQMNTWLAISAVLFVCSFAIYLGRDLRLNTWDLLLSPAAILFDVSDIILNPGDHLHAFTTTVSFFVFLLSIYIVVWQFVRKPRMMYK
ncbi:MAG TPA: DUF1361 domain-containing protein [Candidatus Saccharimonadales bacterium]|nr:DUF1361 domain-containing protein [Candidatus Saccharimonadales bacterium]